MRRRRRRMRRARVCKRKTVMKSVIGGRSQQVADAASEVGEVAREQIRRGVKHARDNVDSVVSDAADRAGAVAGAAQFQASALSDTLEDVIRDRPLSSVALALGLGILIGMAWRR